MGDPAAHDRLHLLLSAVGHDRHARAGLCADARRARAAALGVVGFCRGFVARLRRDAADFGGDARDIDGDLSAADDFPELDLSETAVRSQTMKRGSTGCGAGSNAASRSGTASNKHSGDIDGARCAGAWFLRLPGPAPRSLARSSGAGRSRARRFGHQWEPASARPAASWAMLTP